MCSLVAFVEIPALWTVLACSINQPLSAYPQADGKYCCPQNMSGAPQQNSVATTPTTKKT